jgi:Holliday junction resolvase-like predicted endonuclease
VTSEKQRRIIRGGMDYARRARADWELTRFDVVAVVDGRSPSVRVFPDAFGRRAQL